MNSPIYLINEKVYPRVTLILNTLNPGFGLEKYKITKALEAYKSLYEDSSLYPMPSDENDEGIKTIDSVIEKSQEERNEAAQKGTDVHFMLEQYVNGDGVLDSSLEAKGFKAWCKEYKPEFIETESTIYHDGLKYAGTCDLVAKIKGKTYIVDYKTSNRLYNTNGLQLTAYAKAKKDTFGMDIDKIACLQLGNNQKGFYFKEYEIQEDILESLVKLFYWGNPNFIENQTKKLDQILKDNPDLQNINI